MPRRRNKTTIAYELAATNSEHLDAYCVRLADNDPKTFVALLSRLIPREANPNEADDVDSQ